MKLPASHQITLVASTLAHIQTELESPEKLTILLGAMVSPEWPPGEYDRDALEFFKSRFEEGGESVEGWYGWYAIREPDEESARTLVGAAGYFGPPDKDRTVEIGYSVLTQWQRRGYASEIVKALVENAFAHENIDRVIAHTTEQNPASISVLQRCGFQSIGPGREPGLLRFERIRKT